MLQIRPKRIRIRIIVLIQFPTSEWDLQQLQQDQRESQCHGWRNKQNIDVIKFESMCSDVFWSGYCTIQLDRTSPPQQYHLCPVPTVPRTLQDCQIHLAAPIRITSKLSNFWQVRKTGKPIETHRNPSKPGDLGKHKRCRWWLKAHRETPASSLERQHVLAAWTRQHSQRLPWSIGIFQTSILWLLKLQVHFVKSFFQNATFSSFWIHCYDFSNHIRSVSAVQMLKGWGSRRPTCLANEDLEVLRLTFAPQRNNFHSSHSSQSLKDEVNQVQRLSIPKVVLF